jgi:putative ABC transport system permease protein
MNFLHLKSSLRFLLNNKNYLLINVIGLGIGIASFLVLSLYIYRYQVFQLQEALNLW